jgi:hypothetical protein
VDYGLSWSPPPQSSPIQGEEVWRTALGSYLLGQVLPPYDGRGGGRVMWAARGAQEG